MYDEGKGCAVDYLEAMTYYQMAADEGHANAQNNLGRSLSSSWHVDSPSLINDHRNNV